jgi:hypothetical protein
MVSPLVLSTDASTGLALIAVDHVSIDQLQSAATLCGVRFSPAAAQRSRGAWLSSQ